MARPKGLALTVVLMSASNVMPLATVLAIYSGHPHFFRLLALLSFLACIGFVLIWFYWQGRNWARNCVMVISGFYILQMA